MHSGRRPGGRKKRLPGPALTLALWLVCLVVGLSLGGLLANVSQRGGIFIGWHNSMTTGGNTDSQEPGKKSLSSIPGHSRTTPNPGSMPTAGPGTPTAAANMMIGTNMALFDAHDQVLNSTTARSVLQQI